jgi:hypothetical protein
VKHQASTVPPKHPFKSEVNHQKLLDYCLERLDMGKEVRDDQIQRYAQIDKDVMGWMRLNDTDKERRRKQVKNGIPQATLMNLPLVFVHMDDLVTYFVQTFAPNKGMFYQTGKPDEVKPAQQVVTLMNNHAVYTGFFRQLGHTVWSLMKYNIGGFTASWEEDTGPDISTDADGGLVVGEKVVWSGNRTEALDMYNTFLDPAVNPVDVHIHGEWAAKAKMRSQYWLTSRVNRGQYFNAKRVMDKGETKSACKYYRSPPTEAMVQQNESGTSDWYTSLAGVAGEQENSGYELVELTIRLVPKMFELGESTDYQLYRITILNAEAVIEATPLNNVHGHVPYYVGFHNDDLMARGQKSPAEILQPLQTLASHIMNIHIQSTRKRLFGLTIYNKKIVDFASLPEGEVCGFVPANPPGNEYDLRKAIYRDEQTADTENTMGNLESIMGLVNQFFPSQALPSQIAGIDRAVKNQVTAVQQGVNRRQQKAAMTFDVTCLRPLRFALYYNILQFQKPGEEITDFRGRPIEVNLEELRKTDLPFIIGMGLKAIDRQAAADRLQEIIFAAIQAPTVSQRIDLLGLIDYWTDMMDIDIDMRQFELQPPEATQVGPDGQPIAPGAGGEAGNPIAPATNPAAITAPIYG